MRAYSFKTLTSGFLTGLALVGPLLLTAIVLIWVLSQLISFVGPDSVVGHVITAGGRLFAGDRAHPLLSFAVGVGLVIAIVTALGVLVQNRAMRFLEEGVDKVLGGIPILGNIYRPVAQLVRSMGGGKSEEMQAMGVCRVEFGGGVDTIAFLASADTFDVGGGPARLVLIPTAPVPIGGALLLVASHKVHPIPEMKFDDLMRLYLTMGVTPPAYMKAKPMKPNASTPFVG